MGAAPFFDDKVDEVRRTRSSLASSRGFMGPFADFVIKGKIPLTVLFCLILISSMIVWNLLLVRATSATDWFVSDHPYTLHDKATKYKFLEERTDEKEFVARRRHRQRRPLGADGRRAPGVHRERLRRDAGRQELHGLGELQGV